MRRTLSAALVLLALAAPAAAVAASATTTGSVTTVPTLTTTVNGAGGTLTATRRSGHGSRGISTGAVIAAVIAGLLALACLVWAVFRFGALEPPWLLSARHSLAEASFRTSATWAEFKDWARLGH